MIISSLSDLLPSVHRESHQHTTEAHGQLTMSVVKNVKRALFLFAMPVEIVIASIYVRPSAQH